MEIGCSPHSILHLRGQAARGRPECSTTTASPKPCATSWCSRPATPFIAEAARGLRGLCHLATVSKTVRLTEYQDSMISNLSPMWFAANMIVLGALLFFGFIALFQLRPIASSILMAYAVFWTLTTSYDLLVLRRLTIPGSALTSTDLIGRGCIFIIVWS